MICHLQESSFEFQLNFLAFPSGTAHALLECMNEKAEEIKARTKKFALDVLTFTRTLPKLDEVKIVGRQLIRSATGVGANYRAVCRSRSRPEFVARIGVALEEADESAFWLEILVEGHLAKGPVRSSYWTKRTNSQRFWLPRVLRRAKLSIGS